MDFSYILGQYFNEANAVQLGLLSLSLSAFCYVIQFLWQHKAVKHLATLALAFSVLSFVMALIFRSAAANYFALSNMYEALLVVTIGVGAAYLIFERWFGVYAMGWAVCLISLVMVFYAGSLPTAINPLQPALVSYWRMIHVPPMMLSYGFFTLSFISAVAYLITSSGRPDVPVEGQTITDDEMIIGTKLSYGELYDEVTYRAIAAGFPFLLIGTILGAVWANEAWGNYWSWDPKESASLMTLLGYGVYLHMRINGGHGKRTLAWVAVGGFVLVLLTFVGVNVWGFGSLHSYGAVK